MNVIANKITIVDATPMMADVVSGKTAKPAPFVFNVHDQGAYRRYMLQAPAIIKFFANAAANYRYLAAHPDNFNESEMICQAVGISGDEDDEGHLVFAQRSGNAQGWLIALNADGTRAAVIEAVERDITEMS